MLINDGSWSTNWRYEDEKIGGITNDIYAPVPKGKCRNRALEKKICPGRQNALMNSILHKEMKSRKRNRPYRPGTDVTWQRKTVWTNSKVQIYDNLYSCYNQLHMILYQMWLDDKRDGKYHAWQTDRQTGYPSIDKPWLKFYSEEAINAPLPECTLYENLLENNKDYPKDIAIRYFSRKISYKELIENIETCATSLSALGIKPGEIVTIALPSIPEAL